MSWDVDVEAGPPSVKGSKGQAGSLQDSTLGATWGEKIWDQGIG